MAEEIKVDAGTLISAKVRIALPNAPSFYAHHLAVQDDAGDVILLFFETLLPIIPTEEGAEREEAIKQIEERGVASHCTAKIRVAKHRLPAFVQVLKGVAKRIEEEVILLGKEYGLDKSDNSKS